MTTNLRPGQNHLRSGDGLALSLGEALGDGLDLGLIDEQGNADVVVAEGGVGGNEDVLLGAVVDHGGVGEAGVALDLVHGGDNAGVVDDGLELPRVRTINLLAWVKRKTYVLNREVRDADGAGLALGELGHSFWKNLLGNFQA